jgi:hypothetical protein
MIPIVKENIDAIINVCKTHHLKSLYLFGSAALENDFTKKTFVVASNDLFGKSKKEKIRNDIYI